MTAGPDMDPGLIEALVSKERHALVGRLLPGLAHNLAGSLQVVRLPLDLVELYLGQGNTEEAFKKIRDIQESFHKTDEFVRNLSVYGAHLARSEPREFDLAQMVLEHLDYWRSDMFFKHDVNLVTSLKLGLARVRALYADVALALASVIQNSLDSLEASGQRELSLSLSVEEGRAVVLMNDNGPGLDPEWSERAFLPYEGQKPAPHAGLGLFLGREAIKPWGGELAWRPGPEGGFVLILPLTQA